MTTFDEFKRYVDNAIPEHLAKAYYEFLCDKSVIYEDNLNQAAWRMDSGRSMAAENHRAAFKEGARWRQSRLNRGDKLEGE